MKPFSKCYYLNACGLLLAGLIVTGISVGAGAWNAEKYGEALNLKNRYFEVTEPFTSMQLISNTANVVVKATDTDTCTVTATNMPENTIKVTVEDDKLCINAVQNIANGISIFKWVSILPLPPLRFPYR